MELVEKFEKEIEESLDAVQEVALNSDDSTRITKDIEVKVSSLVALKHYELEERVKLAQLEEEKKRNQEELELESLKLKEEKKATIIKTAVSILGGLATGGLTILLYSTALQAETEGKTIFSQVGKLGLNWILPKKK